MGDTIDSYTYTLVDDISNTKMSIGFLKDETGTVLYVRVERGDVFIEEYFQNWRKSLAKTRLKRIKKFVNDELTYEIVEVMLFEIKYWLIKHSKKFGD